MILFAVSLGLRPHGQSGEEIDRFMREAAPGFDGKYKQRAAFIQWAQSWLASRH